MYYRKILLSWYPSYSSPFSIKASFETGGLRKKEDMLGELYTT